MKYKFLIYISYDYSIPIGKPLEEEILKRGDTIKWFCDLDNNIEDLKLKNNVLQTIKDVLAYQPHIILTITDKVPDFINALKVQVFHGFNAEKRSFKKDHFRIRGFFDLYCTQGPSTTSVFKIQQKKYKTFDIIETGWSKVDPLFPILKKEINDPPNIFIASTFTKRLSLAYNDAVYTEIKSLTGLGKFKFNMVLHPKIPKEIVEKWQELNCDYFTFHETTDLIPLFKQADIMFSDTTSAIQEFMLQEKPIVTINHHIPKPHLINITDAKEIDSALIKALNYPKNIMDNMKAYNLELHPYFDGESSKRVIDAAISFLHKDKSYLKTKPINLMRKYKLRKQLNYFTSTSYNSPFTIDKIIQTENCVKISAVIITFNEEEHLEKCLASLADVADEIIVVDSFSTDRTKEICKQFNVRFIEHKFEGYIEQKNYALSTATNDYILSLDGDEALSEELKSSIIKIKQNWTCDGYYSNRINNYCGQWIKHSDWYPDKKLRLFKKGSGEWKGINPHDSYTLKKNKKEGKLKGDLLHWIYRDYKEHKQKVDNFSTIAAGAYFKLGIKSSIFKIFFRPTWAFFKAYFLRLGFLDGKNGFRICKQTFRVTYLKYKKLYKHWHRQ